MTDASDSTSPNEPASSNNAALLRQNGKSPLWSVPVELSVVVGRARARVGDLLKMTPNAVLPLDTKIDDLVEIFAGDRLIARGELQASASGTGLAVCLTELAGEDQA